MPSEVSIRVDGVDITDIVIFETCNFTTQVNATGGAARFRVRDNPHSYSVVTGKRLTLDIDDDRVWSGYVMGAYRTYALPAMPTGPQYPRLWQIDAVDINILFRSRSVFRLSDPTKIRAPLYPGGTSDTTALAELFDHWLDLSGDNLDTSSMIEHVGDINIDQGGRPWWAGWPWGGAMESIARVPGAIYYIDPDRNVVFTDVDTPNAPYGMSDRPGPGQVGYREMVLLKDGSKLVNDLLAIGMGYGSPDPVVRRLQDAASIAAHGRWQHGLLVSGVFKQATINKIADSWVYGSPQSKRGSKDDKVSVELTTYTPGFRAAQKVAFESEVFGFSDVIPIRKMEITFPVPFDPRYKLFLSHEIDPPWSLVDSLPIPPYDDGPGPDGGGPDGGGYEDQYNHPPPPPPPGQKHYYQIAQQDADEILAGVPPTAYLSTPVRGDAEGPKVWWIRGSATPSDWWRPFPPKEEDSDTYDGIEVLVDMAISVTVNIGAATVTAGDTFTRVEIKLRHEGDPDDGSEDEVVATYNSGVSGGGLRFYGSQVNFTFHGIDVLAGDQIRITCGIIGLVLIAGPSGRIGFFQPGSAYMQWEDFARTQDNEMQDGFTGDGTTTEFQLSGELAAVIEITINGITQGDTGYPDHANNKFVFDEPPAAGDQIIIKYLTAE